MFEDIFGAIFDALFASLPFKFQMGCLVLVILIVIIAVIALT